MTTATVEAPKTTEPATTPVEADVASIFYAGPVAPAPKVETPAPPATVSDPGPSATPPASAVSSDPVTTTPPVGTEKSVEPEPAKDPDKGHAAAARRLGSEVAELRRDLQAVTDENKVLKAKLDGTHVEPAPPTSDEIADRAEFKGREEATRPIAIGLFGQEALQTQVYDDGSPFKTLVASEAKRTNGRSWSYLEVRHHAQPPIAAMNILARKDFEQKYGEDPRQWVTKIEAELTPKLEEKFKKQVATPVTGVPAPSVTEVRGSGGTTKAKTVEQLFYGT